MTVGLPEPWLRGPLPGVSAFVAPLLHSLTQVVEDLELHTEGLTDQQVWAEPFGQTSLGFHLRHIAGSLDRLTTYLEGGQLNPKQLAALEAERVRGASLGDLLAAVREACGRTRAVAVTIDTAYLTRARQVGRKNLPTTVNGLLVHMAEHSQRHLGQAISAAKLARATA